MSFFSNDMRVANTATPSFTQEPNAGQYGWTSYDAAHYNQLIQYVDEVRQSVIYIDEKIKYIESIIIDVDQIGLAIEYIDKQVKVVESKADQVNQNTENVIRLHNDIKVMYDEVVPKYNDFTAKYDTVVRLHGETVVNAASAANSEAGAETWYNKSYELYEELRKGQIYRGTWNPHTNAYPDNGGTNSSWDVILNEDEIEYEWNGIKWFWGDRLIYIKETNVYQHVESGTTVTSVNGKKGAVTLTFSDVNAAPKGFGLGEEQAYTVADADADPLTWNGGKMGWVRFISTTINSPAQGVALIQRYQSGNTSSLSIILFGANSKVYHRTWGGSTWGAWRTLYSNLNKPTPSELGAVNKAGDTMTGSLVVTDQLQVKGATSGHRLVTSGDVAFFQGGRTDSSDTNQKVVMSGWMGKPLTELSLIMKDGVHPQVKRGNTSYSIYYEDNKPTPSEIGAVSLSGSNVSNQREGVNFTSSGTWIASHHGGPGTEEGANKVVLGSLANGAVIGGHNGTFTGWSPLYINTYPGITENHEASPVIMTNPKRQLTISVAGVPTPVHFPVVSRGIHSIRPSWWLAHHALRFMDGADLMRAATNGLRGDPDWTYISRFKFTVRLSVHAPSANVWNHIYWFDVCGYSSTNSTDSYEVSSNKFCHAHAANLGNIRMQLVPSSENGGKPYYELHFPASLAVSTAPDLSLDLTVVAENIFE